MKILLINKEHLSHFDSIEGRHRLRPVLLSDASGFLSADCLNESHFVAQLESVPYTTMTLADIEHLLIQGEDL